MSSVFSNQSALHGDFDYLPYFERIKNVISKNTSSPSSFLEKIAYVANCIFLIFVDTITAPAIFLRNNLLVYPFLKINNFHCAERVWIPTHFVRSLGTWQVTKENKDTWHFVRINQNLSK